ncbi:MAG: hypothetical protein JWS10_3275 [Cypionkella sp.]|uniref:Hint domain-containing protein n=1 Tax=Cypionkella sp. TaxID=2811411 RepID=UPI0026249D97|nr:Hint domain-containing protein [Cypionkella sp.]MDB5660660.1 hypothetical protein [Cypionkella sp.]
MPDRIRDIELYENQGAALTLGATQVVNYSNFNTSTSAEVTFDDSTPNNGAWNAGESATIGGDPATLVGTGVTYFGIKVELLGIPLADLQLSTPVNTALLTVDGVQVLHFYNDDGSETDPAVLLDGLVTQLVTQLSSGIPPLLQGLVNGILANPLQYVQNNALLTTTITAGGAVPFVPCFTAGTMILTRSGEVAVEDLRVGDLVLTVDNGFRPIRWIGRRRLSPRQLELSPQLRPIRIEAGALGNDLPVRPLTVSPQHRCLIRSEMARRISGEREVLVAAKHLLSVDGVSIVDDGTPVTYVHLLLDAHELLISEGTPTESFFVGPMAMSGVSASDRLEIMSLFPALCDESAHNVMPPARKFLAGHIAKSIVASAVKETRPVIESRNYTRA